MTIERVERHAGVDVHLDPDECELFVRLARDAAQATYSDSAPNYFSVCVKLGQRLDELLYRLAPGPRS
jgi:hypothetical protein